MTVANPSRITVVSELLLLHQTRLIIHSSASTATVNKLNLRRQLIAEELLKLKQARLQNHYVRTNDSRSDRCSADGSFKFR